ncbi:MAG: nucleotide exchange factor GrpE [Proteobacteria bacterium]|nr:nucleotide exchange factor GrpE [Pseudomonadota bacterium]MCL2306887.1 nucleotide exchange factor GrpE [Pseudomonadota bacterium]
MPHNPEQAEFMSADLTVPPDAAPEAESPSADLVALLQKAEAEAQELRDAFLRARAETENARRQAREEIAKAGKFGIERFAADLLAVKDALELALITENATSQQMRDGVMLTLKQLNTAFEKAHIQAIDPRGQPFDPHRHQAMQMIESDAPANTVVQVFQRGYLIHDRVLRPAMVIVAKEKTA